MHFNLKKHHTAGITYKDDGQVPKGKIKDGKIVNSNITFKKPFKLQIRASKMIGGNKSIKKKTINYPIATTLLDAIEDAGVKYKAMMIDLENSFIEESTELNANMKFKDAFDAYIESKKLEYKNSSSKTSFNYKDPEAFFNKYLKPIHDKPLNQIRPHDILKLKASMTGKADRTKLVVHQIVNPVYVFVNDNSDDYMKSPAKIKKKDLDWDNRRSFDLSTDEIKALFKRLQAHPISPYREVFMWLMHGRRRNEVLSLRWDDIDLVNNTYTIRSENNKARVNMTYKLSERLQDTLKVQSGLNNVEDMKGWVFRGIRDNTKPLHELRMRKQWLDLDLPIVMHQLRSCIVSYLKNVHNVSNEMSGYILGHTQQSTITERYGVYGYETLNNTLNLMLDDIFDNTKQVDSNLLQLQALFPNKTIEQLEVFLNDN